MIHPTTTDIIELLRQIVSMLQPFAKSHGIMLRFATSSKKLVFMFRTDIMIQDVSSLICHIISYTPQGNTVMMTTSIEKKVFKVTITNTGINLSPLLEIIQECRHQVFVVGDKEKKVTSFELTYPIIVSGKEFPESENPAKPITKKIIPDYYDEIRKRLRSHFAKADNLVSRLSIQYPQEAAFLQKINAVIIANIENEHFDTSVLSREMNMSRASLFRRLKPLIQQPPAKYIRTIRLQKAKEWLETTDITVGEAAFKTGFQAQSHFTKAFSDMFGFLPSSIRRKNHSAINE